MYWTNLPNPIDEEKAGYLPAVHTRSVSLTGLAWPKAKQDIFNKTDSFHVYTSIPKTEMNEKNRKNEKNKLNLNFRVKDICIR